MATYSQSMSNARKERKQRIYPIKDANVYLGRAVVRQQLMELGYLKPLPRIGKDICFLDTDMDRAIALWQAATPEEIARALSMSKATGNHNGRL
jgi:hypothetical protein